ncbi:cytochrome P450 [Pseudovirgaria hyperparasitica]|uniref:Cytochrome P450 n=1 Tax=Pseudovirgaria hyperparasitica TaxID=470096 RepID=A0A6A6W297_9PEZI|nr:cytochrome P450 [Pseudovirgaria hyperparasitica]KAF2756239.1 cytochrome P450 [Pseudovirgaria hyperparasitica]
MYKHRDPIFGLDLILKTGLSIKNNSFNEENFARFDLYGPTFQGIAWATQCINSIEPKNLASVLGGSDWGVQEMRLPTWAPFCGAGFLTTDGEEAKWKRSLLKPFFHSSNISDLSLMHAGLYQMMRMFPKDDTAFDLQPLVFDLYLDLSTSFLFGEPIGALSGKCPQHAKGFVDAFQAGIAGCGLRMAVGPLRHLIPNRSWFEACKKSHQFADYYVDRALEHRARYLAKQKEADPGDGTLTKPRTLLIKMAEVTGDRKLLRDQIVQAMMGSQDTTSVLICNVVHLLSRHKDIQRQLQTEIISLGTKDPSFENLGRMRYLQAILNETLRLHPVFPHIARVAMKDTILPSGGGSDGKSPIFCPAGSLFRTSIYTLHRQTRTYGPDAHEFKPERWLDKSFMPGTYEYVPFGVGRRSCLGKHKAMMESSYMIVRLFQQCHHGMRVN